MILLIAGWFSLVVDRYIAKADKIRFSVWRDFYLTALPRTQCSHSPSTSLLSLLTVLSNTDKSMPNNQIELLNKGIKCIQKVL